MRGILRIGLVTGITLLGLAGAWTLRDARGAGWLFAPRSTSEPEPEMQRLVNALGGQWSIHQAFEPSPDKPGGDTGEGTETWRPGPGGRSIIEDIHTRRSAGQASSGLGLIWWDAQAHGYRVIWCGSANPRGCVIMSQPARWENDQFSIRDEYQRDGKRVFYREVFSNLTSDSFTQTIYQGGSANALKRVLTIHATRTSR